MGRAYMICTERGGPAVLREPIPGVYYTGLNAAGEYCRMAKFNGHIFLMDGEMLDNGVEVEMGDYPSLLESSIRRNT